MFFVFNPLCLRDLLPRLLGIKGMSAGARPVSLLLRLCPKLRSTLFPRGGATSFAFVDVGGSARVALIQSDVPVAAPRGGAVHTPQLAKLLRRVYDPAVHGGVPAAHATTQDFDRHLLCRCAGLHIHCEQTLCFCH